MSWYELLFYFFGLITVVSAFFVVSSKNIVYAAYNLLLTFFGVAGIYVLLGADFIAVVQLIVYVGGILILILFGVMLTNKITDVPIKTTAVQVLPASISVGLLAGILVSSISKTRWVVADNPIPQTTLESLGILLMNEYVLIFELLGILLLIALIGAASIARK